MADYARMTYGQYRDLLNGEHLPAALVNLNAFDENLQRMLRIIEGSGKTLRAASKSVRCVWLLKRLLEQGGGAIKGLMCFTVEEAAFLFDHGFDDLLVAYPTVQPSDMELMAMLTSRGADVCQMADCAEHLDALGAAGRRHGLTLRAAIEVDMSYRPLGDKLHLGVRRSPVRTPAHVMRLVRHAEKVRGVRVAGIMGYEAQIAGLGERNPFSSEFNGVRGIIKKLSIPDVAQRRQAVARALEKNGVEIEFFNAGGTGSLHTSILEDHVTEVTAGSGFLCSHLFSYYRDVHFLPAGFFALQVVRVPARGMVTCLGGGYIASGEAGPDKHPVPYLPQGCRLLPMEGGGEVQTPVIHPDNVRLKIGDPMLFRHAKAGEPAERFNEYIMIRDGAVVAREPTYRGMGRAFL
jgi:D-serine deaminase-like pyridoxal phosphate-dependent protein